MTLPQVSAEFGDNPNAPEPVDTSDREARNTQKRNRAFAKVCEDCDCTPEQLAAMPVADVIEHVGRVVDERAAKSADPALIPGYLKLFVESVA